MPRRAIGLRWLRGLPALAALGLGCEVLVDGRLGPVLCSEDGAVGPPACPDGSACNDGVCLEIVARDGALGEPCVRDRDCRAQDFCLDQTLFGAVGPHICARSCCTSSDCDPDAAAVCWIPDAGGGGFCRPGGAVGRPNVGRAPPGEPCSDQGDCRSGLCDGGACVDACCSDTNCAATGATCQLTTQLVSAGSAWACQRAEPEKLGLFAECSADDQCASGLCFPQPGDDHPPLGGARRCVIPCCGSGTCTGFSSDGVVSNVGCTGVHTSDGSLVQACAELRSEQAIGDVGVRCTTDDVCRGGMCVPEDGAADGFCSDVCFTEASCGDPSLFVCRPYSLGASWALRCAPK